MGQSIIIKCENIGSKLDNSIVYDFIDMLIVNRDCILLQPFTVKDNDNVR